MGRRALLREVARALAAQGVTDARVLVAVSGGVDSTVLGHALGELAGSQRLEIEVAHVDHGLRGAESDADAESVRSLARTLGLPFHLRRVVPGDLRAGVVSRERPTLQEAARTLRREALYEMQRAAGAQFIATAHTRDDQAETVLLRLIRGCGPDSLGGIPERSPDGRFVRPMLGVSRAEVLAYAEQRGLGWREDSSNGDASYTRNRLRTEVLPLLVREFNPKLLRAIGDLAEAERRDAEWLESLVDAEAHRRFLRVGAAIVISGAGFGELPEGLARRLVRRLLGEAGSGRDVRRVHLLRTVAFLRAAPQRAVPRPSGGVARALDLPGGWRLARSGIDFRLFQVPTSGAKRRPAQTPTQTSPQTPPQTPPALDEGVGTVLGSEANSVPNQIPRGGAHSKVPPTSSSDGPHGSLTGHS